MSDAIPGSAATTVYVGAAADGSAAEVTRLVRAAIGALGLASAARDPIVLQPTAPWSHPRYAPDACTRPATLEGVAAAFSPSRVTLGIGGLPGFPTRYTTGRNGYDGLARRLGSLVRFDEAPTRTLPRAIIPRPDGRGTEAVLAVPRGWLDAGLRVSVPRLSGSTILPFGGALRHLYDLLPPDLHASELHRIAEAIPLLAREAPPHLVVLDAIEATHEGGELSGVPIRLGVLIVGTDAAAVDLVGAAAYGVAPDELPIPPGAPHSIDDITIVGDVSLDELRTRSAVVRRLDPNPDAFPLPKKVRVARSPRARLAGPSGLLTETLSMLRRGGISFDGSREITFVIGPAEEIPDGTTDYSTIVFVGDSARGEYKGYSRIVRLPTRNPPISRMLQDIPFAMTVANVRSDLGWRFMAASARSALAHALSGGRASVGGNAGPDEGKGGGDRAATDD